MWISNTVHLPLDECFSLLKKSSLRCSCHGRNFDCCSISKTFYSSTFDCGFNMSLLMFKCFHYIYHLFSKQKLSTNSLSSLTHGISCNQMKLFHDLFAKLINVVTFLSPFTIDFPKTQSLPTRSQMKANKLRFAVCMVDNNMKLLLQFVEFNEKLQWYVIIAWIWYVLMDIGLTNSIAFGYWIFWPVNQLEFYTVDII